MAKRIESLDILENKRLNNEYFTLELGSCEKIPEILPGQFVQVKVDDSADTFLRRPLSVHDVNPEKNSFKLLIQIAGKGTRRLSQLKAGDSVNIIYPLGNSFTLPATGMKVLLAGGGCGIAPLLFMARHLKHNGFTPDILLGFRNSERIIEYEQYSVYGKVFLATEDGSRGEKGFLTDHSLLTATQYDKVYCCGPDPMMKAVAAYCREKKTECEVSLENLMGCGIGVCLCCVTETVKGNVCTCVDGPVFNIKDLKW